MMERNVGAPFGVKMKITAVVVDISALDLACLTAGEDYPAYIDKETTHEGLRRERIGAYVALSRCYRALFSSDMPRILRDEGGKPRLEGGGVAFNYSHIEGAVAIGFMPLCGEKLDTPPDIGVDIEWKMDNTHAEHVHKRYISEIDFAALGSHTDCTPNIEYRTARLDSRGELIWCDDAAEGQANDAFETVCPPESFDLSRREDIVGSERITAEWTILEAALKASSGGFRDLARISEIFPRACIATSSGTLNEKKYMLSVAVYQENKRTVEALE